MANICWCHPILKVFLSDLGIFGDHSDCIRGMTGKFLRIVSFRWFDVGTSQLHDSSYPSVDKQLYTDQLHETDFFEILQLHDISWYITHQLHDFVFHPLRKTVPGFDPPGIWFEIPWKCGWDALSRPTTNHVAKELLWTLTNQPNYEQSPCYWWVNQHKST